MTLYAAITLGSNSFNMLVAHTHDGQPKIVAKYKRKVRLAEGLQADGSLSDEAMQRGLDCLRMFAKMLGKEGVSHQHIAIIATATLRNMSNAAEFKQQAKSILHADIDVICGLREAELIYQGMVATTDGDGRRLVIDIGGASTEFIIGDGDKLLYKTSLEMGCVTFNRHFFAKSPYNLDQFEQAHDAVAKCLAPQLKSLKQLGWLTVVGASGAVQSVIELLQLRQQSDVITLAVLQQLQAEILQQTDASLVGISHLSTERAPTFVASVAILLALFQLLDIKQLVLSGGALREGVLQLLAQRIA